MFYEDMFYDDMAYSNGDVSSEDVPWGMTTGHNVYEMQKALLAPQSVDDLYNTSGGVLTNQQLEGMLATLTLSDKNYVMWQDIPRVRAFSTVNEFDQEIGMGVNDGGFVPQMGNPEFKDPEYIKQIATVSYMSEGWTVGDVEAATQRIVGPERSKRRAMSRLLRNLSLALYDGDSTCIPESIDGISKAIADSGYVDNAIDLRGGNLTEDVFNLAGQTIIDNNGEPENAMVYMSPAGVQNLHSIITSTADVTTNRKITDMGDGNIKIGGTIKAVATAFGDMALRRDKLLGMSYEGNGVPKIFNKSTKSFYESATSVLAPSVPTVTATAVAAPVAGSLFSAGTTRPSGTKQRYRVCARNAFGRSIASTVAETAGNVAADGAVDIKITPNQNDSGDKSATCYVIYGEKVYNSGEFRFLDKIPVASPNPLADVTYRDLNKYIPGTARSFIIDQTKSGEDRVMALAQLLPIHNTPLGKAGRYTAGLINLYLTMKYYKPGAMVEIRNVGVEKANINQINFV
jgi:hypothetical protein